MSLISAKVIADSIANGVRLTTIQIVFPKVLIAEVLTHRVFSRNFSSSRAIPVDRVNEFESFEPLYYGKNQPGMVASDESIDDVEEAQRIWYEAIEYCKRASERLKHLGLHKQWSNRMNDWHIMANGIISSTEWNNFFIQRCHHDAQPEIQLLANKIKNIIKESEPKHLSVNDWHLPYTTDEELSKHDVHVLQKISAARCARVSYMNHDGSNPSIDCDLKLYEKLVGGEVCHYSPLEHQATPDRQNDYGEWYNPRLHGNFYGWKQHRKIHEVVRRNVSKLGFAGEGWSNVA